MEIGNERKYKIQETVLLKIEFCIYSNLKFNKTMTYSLSWLISEYEKLQHKGKNLDYLFFWGHKSTQDGSLSKTIFSQW